SGTSPISTAIFPCARASISRVLRRSRPSAISTRRFASTRRVLCGSGRSTTGGSRSRSTATSGRPRRRRKRCSNRSPMAVRARSPLAEWLDDPAQGVRELNQDDALLTEVLFAVHDYLHVWAYHLVRDAVPDLGFGRPPASEAELEDHVFCHLLTEAVATVGLD